MKKVILLAVAAVMLSVAGANAQDFGKNDWFLGAKTTGLGLEHIFLDGDSITEFDLSVNGGYFFSNKFAVDALLGFNLISMDGESTNTFTYGVGVRYYPISNLFARVGFDGKVIKDFGDAQPMYAGITVGYDLFISEKVFFEPAIYYKKGLNDKADETNRIGLSIGVGVKF